MEVRKEFTGFTVATSSMAWIVRSWLFVCISLIKNVLTSFDGDVENFLLNLSQVVEEGKGARPRLPFFENLIKVP